MSSDTNTDTQSTDWFARFWKFVLRLILAVVLGLALGAGLYWGGVTVFERVVRAIQDNSQGIEALEVRLQLVEDQMEQQNSDQRTRLQALEVSGDRQRADMDDLQGQIEALTAAQDALLEDAVVELQRMLDAAAADQDDLQNELAAITADLEGLRSEIDDLAGDLDSQQAENDAFSQKLADSEERMALIEAQWDEELAQISEILLQIQKFKAIELLTRSRYHLVQNNLGLAGQDIQSAYDLLSPLQDEIPEAQADQFAEILIHLESALAYLPQQPVAAADDVDSAWNLLLSDMADQISSGE